MAGQDSLDGDGYRIPLLLGDEAAWTVFNDADFSARWHDIKARFAALLPPGERLSERRQKKGERGIWQRRFREHVIRNDQDMERHADYTHFNPVKHGHVHRVVDWPYSSFHRNVALGTYSADWGGTSESRALDLE